MSGRLPEQFDPFQLAAQRAYLKGFIPLNSMPRLKAAQVEVGDQQAWGELHFHALESGLVIMTGNISALVRMTCQRCLGLVDIDIEHKIRLALVNNDAEAALLQDEYETYEVRDNKVFTRDLIEDEILLSLPIIPLHAQELDCDPKMLRILKQNRGDHSVNRGMHPFSVLKELKRK